MAQDERLRVTVVGARRQVDLTVPARAAIAEYSARLLDLCGTDEDDGALPPVWSLAPAGIRPYPPSHSLVEAGVADGAVLYLRDFAAGELDDPLVTDMVELVDAATRARRAWDARLGAAVLLVGGLLTLIAGLAAFSAGQNPPSALSLAALLGGVASALLAHRARVRRWPLPSAAITSLALATVPLLAVAPTFLPPARVDGGTYLISLVCGAVAGAVTARIVLPRLITTATLALILVVLPAAVGLVLARADLAEAAATVSVLALVLLRFAPAISGHLVASSQPDDRSEGTAEEVDALVGRGRLVLTGTTVVAGAVLVACMVLLAVSGGGFAIALATALGVTLLLRAGALTVLPARLALVLAGGAGLVAVVLLAGVELGDDAGFPHGLAVASGPSLVALAGLGMAGSGLTGAFRAAEDPDDPEDEPAAWIGGVASLLTTLCVPLALGVFGVFAMLFHAGGQM